MFRAKVLKRVLVEMGRLENATKKRSIRLSAKITYWPLRDIAELAMWCLGIKVKRFVIVLLLLTTCFLKALPPFPPQTPPYPPQRNVLPTDGYFLIGWDTTMGPATATQRSPNPNSVPINARANIVKIAASKSSVAGMGSTVVLNTSGCVIALQIGGISSYEYAVPNDAKSGVVDVLVSSDYCYAIKNSGKLLIWRITDNSGAALELPEAVSSGVVSVSVMFSDSGFVVLRETGEVKCFSRQTIMPPNDPTMPNMPPGMNTSFVFNEIQVPSEVSSGVVQILSSDTSGAGTIFALKNNGQVIAWNYAASVYTLRVLPDILLSGVARIKSDSLFLMQDGSVVSLFYNPAGEATASTYRGTEKDGVDVGRDLMINNTYILTKDGAVLGYDSTGNSLALNSELGSDIKEISIWNGNNFALKNTGKLLKWGYPVSALDTSLPAFTSSGIPFLGDLGNVSNLMLSSSADTAVSLYCGLPLNVLVQLVADRIKNQPSNYGIATHSALSSAIEPLATKNELTPLATKSSITNLIDEGKASGIASVRASPNTWSLFTTSQIQNMAIGDLVLTKEVNGQFVLNYDIEQSTDLQSWTPYQALSLPLNGLPTDKAFVRIKAKQ